MSNLAYSIIYPQPRKLTLGLVLALSLFSLTVSAQTVVRTGRGGTESGTDIGEVQGRSGAAVGDVIKVSRGATFNTGVVDPVNNFTVESASGDVVNVPVQAGYSYDDSCRRATFSNIRFTSANSYLSSFMEPLSNHRVMRITISGNVYFSRFQNSVFNYYQTSTEEEYYPYIFWCNSGSTLTFSSNHAREGGAINRLGDLIGENSAITFSSNQATDGGAIYELTKLSGSDHTLKFISNRDAYFGGAIYAFGDLSGANNTLTFSNNQAYFGGAIYEFKKLSGSGNTLEFTSNYSEDRYTENGGAIWTLKELVGENNKLTFSSNQAVSGGAIYELTKLSGAGNTLEFSDNTAKKDGGAIRTLGELSGSYNTLSFSNNIVWDTPDDSDYFGGAIYELTKLSGVGNTLKFTGNTAAVSGGSIYDFGDLSGNNNILEFSNNTANGNGDYDGGGAIGEFCALSGENNSLTFSGNTAYRGGAIRTLGELSGSYNTLTFSNNIVIDTLNYNNPFGGAIYELTKLSGSGNTLTFSGNTAGRGGAIDKLTNLSGSGNILTFSGNTAKIEGGAIYELTNFSGSGNTLEFTGNSAEYRGGAIYAFGVSGNNNTLTFSNNQAPRGGAIYTFGVSGNNNTLTFSNNQAPRGGAIYDFRDFSGENNTLTFSGNTADMGGAIGFTFPGVSGNNNTLTFSGNTALVYGGAIYAQDSIVFSGNNTLTFTGNKARTAGNDIYLLLGQLSFNGGTYFFDGGILNLGSGYTTISDGANVTIAGRNDDSVNEYEFRNVALTANLTATLDEIEYLHGKFTVGENGLLTINKGDDTATIKSSTNGGVLDLVIYKATEVETISISSGRIDIQGYLDGTVDVIDGATYSPGNSVGFTNVTGDVIIENGFILFEFGEYPDGDSNHDVLTVIDGSFSIESGIVNLLFENSDVSLWATEGAEYLLVSDDGFASETIDLTRFLGNYHGYFSLEGRTDGLYLVGLGTPVPEPSTWALLILGAAGLAYMRKRSRQ